MTPADVIVASTSRAAEFLGTTDRGSLVPGKRADFLVLEGSDWRELIYTLGANPVREVWIRGQMVTA